MGSIHNVESGKLRADNNVWLLARIAGSLSGATAEQLDAAINLSLEHLGTFTHVDRVFIIQFSTDRLTFTSTHEWCAKGIHSQLDYFINLPVTVFPWTARQLLAGDCVAIHNLDEYPPEATQERNICIGEGIQSIVFMPMRSEGDVIGAIGFDMLRIERLWDRDLLGLLKVTGTLVADCLMQRRTHARLRDVGHLERQKLGQDLHDSLGQDITGISFSAAALHKALAKEHAHLAKRAEDIGAQAVKTLNTVRDLIRGLKSYDAHGAPVTEALTALAREANERSGLACRFVDTGVPPIEDPEACTQLLWIAREGVNNAIRHGQAKTIEIVLDRHGDKLSLTVRDDGIGLPENFIEKEGIGLKVMRFRAAAMGGQVTINSRSESGTRLRCVFPAGPLSLS